MTFVEAHGLVLPRQYLYSTRGEIALAAEEFDEAESWFKRAIDEAERYDNGLFVAGLQANLGLRQWPGLHRPNKYLSHSQQWWL